MSSIECLFCKHINPPDAIFCNECGTQLNMRPCENCGAIDARSATNCYKCGAAFLSQEPHEPHKPAVVWESAGDIHDGAPAASFDSAQPPMEPSTSAVQEPAVMAIDRSRPKWLIPAVGLSLALIAGAVFINFNHGKSEGFAEKLGVASWLSPISNRLKPVESTQPAQTAVAPVPATSTMPPASGIDANEKVVAAPADDSRVTMPRQLPVNDADARVTQDSLALNDCPLAVSTLGLCSPDAKPGKGR